jgi:hypothetical protein
VPHRERDDGETAMNDFVLQPHRFIEVRPL